MKKLLVVFLAAILLLAACGKTGDGEKKTAGDKEVEKNTEIRVASVIPSMIDMLEVIKPLLEKDGIDMEIVPLGDNIQPNTALANKEVDANFFQHPPYMEQFNEANDANLVAIQPIYHAILGAYSNKYDSVEDLPEGAEVAVPNDPANLARSLQLLEEGGLITLAEGPELETTTKDIIDNPKNLKIVEVDLLMLARAIDDVDLVTMLPAYAQPLGLTPEKDSLIDEGQTGSAAAFPIALVAREDNANSDAIKKLAEHLAGPEIRAYIEEEFTGTAYPAF